MKVFLCFLLLLLSIYVNAKKAECRTDSDCSDNRLCVYGQCLFSNHASGGVVITDENADEPCTFDCPVGKKCVAGACVRA